MSRYPGLRFPNLPVIHGPQRIVPAVANTGASIGILRGHAPGYSNVAHLDGTPTLPHGAPDDIDRALSTGPFFMIYFRPTIGNQTGDTTQYEAWVETTDAAKPAVLGNTSCYVGTYKAGDYRDTTQGGTAPGGHGIGNFFLYPTGTPTKAYCSAVMKITGAAQGTSNKWLNYQTDVSGGQILTQLDENGLALHCEELTGQLGDVFIDEGTTISGETHVNGKRLRNDAFFGGAIHQVEVLIDLTPGNKIMRTWLDGVPQTDATGLPFVSTSFNTFGWNQFRGGGGETIAADFTHVYYDIYLEYQ